MPHPMIAAIYTAAKAGATCEPMPEAELVAGGGVLGDRYCNGQGTFSFKLNDSPDVELTLIEQEEIDHFNQRTGLHYDSGLFRRNIVTRDVRLNDLVGQEFMLGAVRLRGIRLCEPCSHLRKLLGPEIMDYMVHRAGLRAQILSHGHVACGDDITLPPLQPQAG